MQNSKKSIWMLVVFVLVVILATGYYLFNKKPLSIETSAGIKATSDELYSSYTKDPV